MFAPLFLHFRAIYPVRYHLFEDRRWRNVLLYLPAFVLLCLATAVFLRDQLVKVVPRELLNYSPEFVLRFSKAAFIHFTIALVASAAVLLPRFVLSKNTVARQRGFFARDPYFTSNCFSCSNGVHCDDCGRD